MMRRLGWIFPVFFATAAYGITVDVNLYKSGSNDKTVIASAGGKVNIDVVLKVFGQGDVLTGYEMDIYDETATNAAIPGMSIQSILDRKLITGWGDLSNSAYPLSLGNTPLDAAAYATNAAYDLPGSATGLSYVVETITLTAPTIIPEGGFKVMLRPQDSGLLFAGAGGAPGTVGDVTGAWVTIVPEPMSGVLFAAVAAIGLIRRR